MIRFVRDQFIQYIKAHFPNSNLNASLCEVWADYELHISTWLGQGKHSKQDLMVGSQLGINIFEDLFLGHSEPLYALINQWETRRDIYMFNQFKGLKGGDFEAWESFDETHEVQREQILLETTLDNINYRNIVSRFVHRDYDETPDLITSRIYFIHPKKHMYYLYFDNCVWLGSKDVDNLFRYYRKYYRHISSGNKAGFEQYIL